MMLFHTFCEIDLPKVPKWPYDFRVRHYFCPLFADVIDISILLPSLQGGNLDQDPIAALYTDKE